MSYESVVLADGPVGYWPLSEASGSVANDISGNANNGTYSGSYSLGNAGLVASGGLTCADFTGGELTIPNAVPLQIGGSDMSLEVWFNASSIASFGALIDEAVRYYSAFFDAGATDDLFVSFGDPGSGGGVITLSQSVALGTTYYLVIVRSGSNLIVYLNDVSAYSAAPGTGVFGGANNISDSIVLCGNPSGGGGAFNALAQHFAIYNFALSPTQVTAHYNAASGGATPNPQIASGFFAA